MGIRECINSCSERMMEQWREAEEQRRSEWERAEAADDDASTAEERCQEAAEAEREAWRRLTITLEFAGRGGLKKRIRRLRREWDRAVERRAELCRTALRLRERANGARERAREADSNFHIRLGEIQNEQMACIARCIEEVLDG